MFWSLDLCFGGVLGSLWGPLTSVFQRGLGPLDSSATTFDSRGKKFSLTDSLGNHPMMGTWLNSGLSQPLPTPKQPPKQPLLAPQAGKSSRATGSEALRALMEILRNPPRPLVLRRVDEALPASNPPISDHKGEGKPPLPLPASSGSARLLARRSNSIRSGSPLAH